MMKGFKPKEFRLANKKYIKNNTPIPTDLPSPEPFIQYYPYPKNATANTRINILHVNPNTVIDREKVSKAINQIFPHVVIFWNHDNTEFAVFFVREKHRWGAVLTVFKHVLKEFVK